MQIENRWGYVNTVGEQVVAPTFEYAGHYWSGFADVQFSSTHKHPYGWIDREGKVIWGPER